MLGPHVDPDARAPDDRFNRDPPIFEIQTRTEEIRAVLCERDPHRLCEVAGSATKILIIRHGAAAAAHHVDPLERIERPNQHGRRRSMRFGDDVHHPVHTVVQIHVRVSGLTVHRGVPPRRTRRSVAGRIALADVRFDFYDDAARAHTAPIVNEHFAE